MAMALRQIGYENVHDFEEHLEYNLDNYLDFFEGRVDSTIFKKMYQNVDAIVATPAGALWHIISKQFPDAKIILMIRDSDDAWYQSFLGKNKNIWNIKIISRLYLNSYFF